MTCSYNPGCLQGDGPSGTATCSNGRWQVVDVICTGEGGSPDAGDDAGDGS
jgi:hypothetical protein